MANTRNQNRCSSNKVLRLSLYIRTSGGCVIGSTADSADDRVGIRKRDGRHRASEEIADAHTKTQRGIRGFQFTEFPAECHGLSLMMGIFPEGPFRVSLSGRLCRGAGWPRLLFKKDLEPLAVLDVVDSSEATVIILTEEFDLVPNATPARST
ncbi:hypothetical protein QAD02_020144 [Eretmocerus hayati]|uniref:Uncharacterized protein n=1 Tax=Eretmocerus hayati TaxID=131215 RepID=A0ACC2PLU1_9HYME|nr:hypothetical protein QAD02_020144 [Eretmocerus hayati]